METRTFKVNAKTYVVPLEVAEAFDKYVKDGWKLPTTLNIDTKTGTRTERVTASLKSVSFSCMLSEWATNNWQSYAVA